MKKSTLRKKYYELRDSLSEKDIENYSNAIFQNLKKLDIWNKSIYHIFLSIESKKEISTTVILNKLWDINKKITVSKSNFKDSTLTNYYLEKYTTLEINKWGIPEPINAKKAKDKDIDIVFIPLLAFDEKGYRVGYGKGFYDNFLANCKKDVIKIGLSFFESERPIDDIHMADIALDLCITPNKIYYFG